ncbi:MAG: hypothetical protein H7X97_01330 [Opitutaceae bacterium]|nr:hypothetical protein [Verrucomicrobiales bacterium]
MIGRPPETRYLVRMALHAELVGAWEKDSRRLMVVLHGLGDSIDGYRWLPSALGLPWMNYILVNAPDPYFGGGSWYDFGGDPAPGVERSRLLLAGLLDELRSKNFPTDQTTLFGFSQGCLMTLETALTYPHRFAGVVGISGYAHNPEGLLQKMPAIAREQRFLITHGTQDTMIPIKPVRQQNELLRAAGLTMDWREFAKAHTIAGEEELKVIRDFVVAGYPADK